MKKGISLIVLVITIIIIIILAGAVILNLADNNPIENASEAALLSEQSDVNSGLNVYLGSKAVDEGATYKIALMQQVQKTDATSGNKLYKDAATGAETENATSEVQKKDETGAGIVDDAGNPVMETVDNEPVMEENKAFKKYEGKDVEGNELKDLNYYELGSFKVTCGEQDLTAEFASTDALTKAISFTGSKYLGKTHRLVMNLGGNLRLVEGKTAK